MASLTYAETVSGTDQRILLDLSHRTIALATSVIAFSHHRMNLSAAARRNAISSDKLLIGKERRCIELNNLGAISFISQIVRREEGRTCISTDSINLLHKETMWCERIGLATYIVGMLKALEKALGRGELSTPMPVFQCENLEAYIDELGKEMGVKEFPPFRCLAEQACRPTPVTLSRNQKEREVYGFLFSLEIGRRGLLPPRMLLPQLERVYSHLHETGQFWIDFLDFEQNRSESIAARYNTS